MRLAKSPSGLNEGGGELLAGLPSLGLADMAKDAVRCLTSVLGPHRWSLRPAITLPCPSCICHCYAHGTAIDLPGGSEVCSECGVEPEVKIVIEFVAFALSAETVLVLAALVLVRVGSGLEDRKASGGIHLPACPPTPLSALVRRACGLDASREEAGQGADTVVDDKDRSSA